MTKISESPPLKPVVAGCAMEQFFVFFGKRWALQIVWSLGENGELAFGRLSRTLPGRVSAKVLTARLRDLEKRGLLIRREAEKRGQPVRYGLSGKGVKAHRLFISIAKSVNRISLVEGSHV